MLPVEGMALRARTRDPELEPDCLDDDLSPPLPERDPDDLDPPDLIVLRATGLPSEARTKLRQFLGDIRLGQQDVETAMGERFTWWVHELAGRHLTASDIAAIRLEAAEAMELAP